MLSGPLIILFIVTGLSWTVAYLLIIARARRDKIYGMPVVALCGNLSWEIINSFIERPHGIIRPFPIIWLSIDACGLVNSSSRAESRYLSVPAKSRHCRA